MKLIPTLISEHSQLYIVSSSYVHSFNLVLIPPAPEVQSLCSVIVWNRPDVPPCDDIIGYDVRLYSHLVQHNVTRRVGSNGTFYIITEEDNLANYVQVSA